MDRLAPAARAKVKWVLDNISVFRRLPLRVIVCDPDFYQFLAFFNNSAKTSFHDYGDTSERFLEPKLEMPTEEQEARRKGLQKEIEELEQDDALQFSSSIKIASEIRITQDLLQARYMGF